MKNGVAVITGAGSGIGRAVAMALAAAGYGVILVGRREIPLKETRDQCGRPGAALVVPADVTSETAVDTAFETGLRRFGRIDLLFNNAGTFAGGAPFDEITLESWRNSIDTNLTGAFLCARAAFRAMKAQSPRGGRIINCGSVSAHVPRPHATAYTASKHAITGLTRAISLEGRAWNIACGQIDIGNAATGLTAAFSHSALQADGSRKEEPVMNVSNVADCVLFMASLPAEANVQFVTVMATTMPFIGRG
jgi:NADP-dependent 3-hydroxy acid dehydrogenase YdfG